MQIKIIQIHLVKLENYLLHVVCQIQEDYEGGELEFDFRNNDPDQPSKLENVQKYYQEEV
jgi:hypothetical protein